MSAPDPIEPLSPMVVGPSSRRNQAIGAVMYLVAAFLFALNGSVAKAQIEAGLSPAEVTEVRTIGCALILLIYILIVNPGSLKVRRTEIPFLLLFGVLAYALTPFLFFLSVELLPVAIAALLAFLAPVLVALWLRYVKHEAVGRSIWLSLVLVVGGLILVSQVWSGMTLNPLGVFFGLLTAAALAAYLLLGEAGAAVPFSNHPYTTQVPRPDSKVVLCFVDGHVEFLPIYSAGGVGFTSRGNPPSDYGYIWGASLD